MSDLSDGKLRDVGAIELRSEVSSGGQNTAVEPVAAGVDASDGSYEEGAGAAAASYNYDYSSKYRWFLMSFYLIISFIAGPYFFNWPPFDDMFNWANANSNLCDPSDPTFELLDHGVIYCDAKNLANENIAGIASSLMYVFDFVGGILLDSLGSKVSCIVGMTLELLGWILLGCSSPTGFNGYKAAVVLMAAGCDPLLFGLLPIGNIFPNWESTAIAAIGTTRSLSFANGLILRGIWSSNRTKITLRGISFVYAGLLAVLLIGIVFFVPWQPFPKLKVLEKDETAPSLKRLVRKKPVIDFGGFYRSAKRQILEASKFVFTWRYGIFIIVACVQLLRNSYYANSYKVHLPDVKGFYEISLPLSVIPCPFMGIMADRISSAFTLGLTVATAALSMLFAAFRGGKGTQAISVVFNWWFQSFTSSEFYVYLAYNYPMHIYGKLAGLTLLVGGMIGLLGGPMNSFVDRTGKYASMDILITAFGAGALCITVVLHIFVERKTRARNKALKEQDARESRALDA